MIRNVVLIASSILQNIMRGAIDLVSQAGPVERGRSPGNVAWPCQPGKCSERCIPHHRITTLLSGDDTRYVVSYDWAPHRRQQCGRLREAVAACSHWVHVEPCTTMTTRVRHRAASSTDQLLIEWITTYIEFEVGQTPAPPTHNSPRVSLPRDATTDHAVLQINDVDIWLLSNNGLTQKQPTWGNRVRDYEIAYVNHHGVNAVQIC